MCYNIAKSRPAQHLWVVEWYDNIIGSFKSVVWTKHRRYGRRRLRPKRVLTEDEIWQHRRKTTRFFDANLPRVISTKYAFVSTD